MEQQQNANRIVFLRGKKSVLRPLRKETDIELFLKWLNDPEVSRLLQMRTPLSYAEESELLDQKHKQKNDFILVLETEEGKAIGTMGLHRINWTDRVATTGACIGEKEYWGKGYGSDAKMALLKWAFDELGLYKVYSQVIAFNERSAAYSRKCGYVEEARLPNEVFREGARHDKIILAAYRERFIRIWEHWNKTGEFLKLE